MEITKIKKGQYSWTGIFGNFILQGKPFILSSEFTDQWSCKHEWTKADGSPNLENFVEKYGAYRVPVVNCNDGYEDDIQKITVSEYISGVILNKNSNLYLKDWHFQNQCKSSSVYKLPPFLSSDWINFEEWTEDRNNPTGGDYRFLYFGGKGTWTPFHSDVLSTHSWSANICGKKQWYILPLNGQEYFRTNKNYPNDIRIRPDLWKKAGVVSFIQESGEIVFIPSNYYHQVHNLETTISLNHNSINSSNIALVWDFLQQKHAEIMVEINDVRSAFSEAEFQKQIELILNADARLNYSSLLSLLNLVINSRCNISFPVCYVCHAHADPRQCIQNRICLFRWNDVCTCQDSMCEKCTSFLAAFELSIALYIKEEILKRINT